MKIGILTFHLAHNYGAVLQCYALQEVLGRMGHQVSIINYQQPYILEQFKPKRLFGIRSFIKTLVNGGIKDYIYRSTLPYIKRLNFENYRKRFLKETAPCYTIKDIPYFDLYIIGSDQPWNPDLTGGPDLVYWGQFEKKERSKLVYLQVILTFKQKYDIIIIVKRRGGCVSYISKTYKWNYLF